MMNYCCSVTKLCPTLCDPMDCSTPDFPVLHHFLKLMSIESVMPSNHLILCLPLFLLSSIFPSTRVFSFFFFFPFFSDSLPQVAKYWSFSVSPSSEYAELISFRIDWFDFLAVQEMIADTVYPKYLPKNVSYVFFFGISQSSYMR